MSDNNIVVRRQWSELFGFQTLSPDDDEIVHPVPAVQYFWEPKAWQGRGGAMRILTDQHAIRQFAGGGVIIAGLGMVDDLEQLRVEHDRLALEVAELRGQVRELRQQIEPPALRDLTEEAAKAEIQAFFDARQGETIYASDVAAALSLDYDKVARWLQELETDGQITIPAEPAGGSDDADARAG